MNEPRSSGHATDSPSGSVTDARWTKQLALMLGRRLYGAIFLLFLLALVLIFFNSVSRVMLVAFMGVIVALAMHAIVRHIRDTDEMQRRIELEAVSFATALVSLVYLSAGFLQSAKVIDIPSAVAMIWVFPLVIVVYAIAKLAIARRYR